MSNYLVASYSLSSPNDSSYQLTFAIPDNCEYAVTLEDDIYIVTVNLKYGQTQPSSKYVTYTYTFATGGDIEIVFDQEICEGNTSNRKPALRVSY